MPAASPSKASVANVLAALAAAGLRPSAVHVSADGAFRVEVASSETEPANNLQVGAKGPDAILTWSDVA